MTPPYRWQALDSDTLHIRAWPGEAECVVFNERSGDLHLLNPEASDVLSRLSSGPATLNELAATFPGIDRQALERVLESFDALGLIRPVLP